MDFVTRIIKRSWKKIKLHLYKLTDDTLTMAYYRKLGTLKPYYLVKGKKQKQKHRAHDDIVRKTIRLNGTI